jgi:hypothetical protein
VRTWKNGKQSEPKPRSRRYTNDTMARIINLFSWAVPRELVPPDRVHGLREVPPLRPGEIQAVVDAAPREAVDDELVDAVLRSAPMECGSTALDPTRTSGEDTAG